MNYIKEMNAFYSWLDYSEVSASAINLWHALMHIHNKTRWASSFTVAESVLTTKTGLSGRTIRNARAELKKLHRIHFVSSRGKAARYTINSLVNAKVIFVNHDEEDILPDVEEKSTEKFAEVRSGIHTEGGRRERPEVQTMETRSEINAEDSSAVLSYVPSTLVKQNKTRQNKNAPHSLSTQRTEDVSELEREKNEEDFGQLVTFFEKEIGPITPFVGEMLACWASESGIGLATFALQIASKENARNKVKYAEAVLKRWKNERVTTLSHAKKMYETPKGKSVRSSLFTPSEETLQRQRKSLKAYENKEISAFALPY